MKKSEHKTTMVDVLAYLRLNGPTTAEAIGEHFWPDKVGFGPSRGGPSSCAVAASYLLHRMLYRGWVNQEREGWRKWGISTKGIERLSEQGKEQT